MLCTKCGRARTGTEKYCITCGKRFPEPTASTGQPPPSDRDYPEAKVDDATEARPVRSQRAPARRLLTPPIVALVVILAAGAGVGTWYAFRKASSAAPSASVSPSPMVSSSSPLPSPSAQPTTPASDFISLAPAAAQYPDATSIQSVITQYFQAINNHDYVEYLRTQSADVAMSSQQFQTAFRSTADSDVIVSDIATASDEHPQAYVTFISQQQPQDGPDGESCTNWQVQMFLDNNGRTYTIGAPPADYHASYQPC